MNLGLALRDPVVFGRVAEVSRVGHNVFRVLESILFALANRDGHARSELVGPEGIASSQAVGSNTASSIFCQQLGSTCAHSRVKQLTLAAGRIRWTLSNIPSASSIRRRDGSERRGDKHAGEAHCEFRFLNDKVCCCFLEAADSQGQRPILHAVAIVFRRDRDLHQGSRCN